AGLSEVIVQARADDVAIEASIGLQGIDGERLDSGHITHQWAHAIIPGAEIIVEIFDFGAPVRREHPLGTGAARPTNERARVGAGPGPCWNDAPTTQKGLGDAGARADATISEAAGSVKEQAPDQDAETTARGAEIVELP